MALYNTKKKAIQLPRCFDDARLKGFKTSTTRHPLPVFIFNASLPCWLASVHNLGALKLRKLNSCRVVCGPVRGPIYVEACTDCVIVASGRQVGLYRRTILVFCVIRDRISCYSRLQLRGGRCTYIMM